MESESEEELPGTAFCRLHSPVTQTRTAPTTKKPPKKGPPKKRTAEKAKDTIASTSKAKVKEGDPEEDEDGKAAVSENEDPADDEDGESELEEDAAAASKRCPSSLDTGAPGH